MTTNNANIISIGRKLRNKIIFDIHDVIDTGLFFKSRFFKEQELIDKITANVFKKSK